MEVEEEPDPPRSPGSSAPPPAQSVAMSAASLSENPVFKRARGEKIVTGASVAPRGSPSARHPMSQAELDVRFFELQDGAESVRDEDMFDVPGKKQKKRRGSDKEASGLRAEQIDSLADAAAFGEPSTAPRGARPDDAATEDGDDAASESACLSAMPQPTGAGLGRFNGVNCLPCLLAASMNPIDEFLRENLGNASDEAIYKFAAEIYERDVAGPSRREGAHTPHVAWKQMKLHYEQHSMDPIIQRHVELRILQQQRTMLQFSACRDDGLGNSDLDLAKSNHMNKILTMSRGLRQELEDLKRVKKK